MIHLKFVSKCRRGRRLFFSHTSSHCLAVFIDNVSFPHNANSVTDISNIYGLTTGSSFTPVVYLPIPCCFNYYSFIKHLQMSSMGIPSFFFKTALTIPDLLIFHINFKIRLLNSRKNSTSSLVLRKF